MSNREVYEHDHQSIGAYPMHHVDDNELVLDILDVVMDNPSDAFEGLDTNSIELDEFQGQYELYI